MLVQPARVVVPRDQWFKTLEDYHIHEYQVEEQVIDVDGDLGVVLQRVSMKVTALGQDRSGTFIISDVWRRRSDGW